MIFDDVSLILGAMMPDDECVPALVLCGGTLEEREKAIARSVEPLPGGKRIAVLRAGIGMFSAQAKPLGPHVVVKRTPIGCLCCTAGVMFRVALLDLLRSSRPGRVIIDLGAGDHVPTLEAQLRSDSLARAVHPVKRLDLDEQCQPSERRT